MRSRAATEVAELAVWPHWTPLFITGLTTAVAMASLVQRHAFTSASARPAIGLAAIAVSPWILECFGLLLPPGAVPVKIAVFAAPVIGGTLALVVAYPNGYDYAPFLLVMLSGTMAAVFGPWPGAAVTGVSAAALIGLEIANVFNGSAIWCFALCMGWASTSAVRRQLCTLAELQTAQADLARQAADEERRRLAREIHDLVAHSLAVTMLHLTGARLALRAGESGDALEALEQAELTGRLAMGEIRRTVGLLGSPAESATGPPTPRAGDIPALVEEFRAAGLQVSLLLPDDAGALDALSPAVGVTLYRAVQESLSNTVKHAPGQPAAVQLDTAGDTARLTVVNPLPAPPSLFRADDGRPADRPDATGAGEGGWGHGLRGMHERARALGGVVSAGPRGGSWVVEACVPLSVDDRTVAVATAVPAVVRPGCVLPQAAPLLGAAGEP